MHVDLTLYTLTSITDFKGVDAETISSEVELYLDCGSIVEGTIEDAFDIPIFAFNNTWMENNVTITTCGSSISVLVVLRDQDLSLIGYDQNGCDDDDDVQTGEYYSPLLSTGLYVIHPMGQNGSSGNFTMEIGCIYPTRAPTS